VSCELPLSFKVAKTFSTGRPGWVADRLLRRAGAPAPWAGRWVFAGLRSLGFPGNTMGDVWRAADLVREHRGDSHVITWAVGGADAVEVLLSTEQWWGLPPGRTPQAAVGPTPTWMRVSTDCSARG
jgi:hypothetical protein